MNQTAAIFDVDGTLVQGNIVDYYLFFVRKELPPAKRFWRQALALLKAPYWLVLDRIDRTRFNRNFYRSYRGLPSQQIRESRETCFEEFMKKRLIGETLQRLEEHRARGDKILLVSGSLDFCLDPLAKSVGAEACLCPSLLEDEGTFSGRLDREPVVGEEKARLLRKFAREHDLDLSMSYAYADSASDLPILECVGHPVVVLPEAKLRKIASRRGWEILEGHKEAA